MKLGSLMFGMAIAMFPIAYREPRGGCITPPDPPRWGGLRPPTPYDAKLKDNCVVFEKSMGVGVMLSI